MSVFVFTLFMLYAANVDIDTVALATLATRPTFIDYFSV